MHNRQPYVFQTSLERRIYSLIDNEAELTEAVLNDVYITAQVKRGSLVIEWKPLVCHSLK
jgi:hypothetical protein